MKRILILVSLLIAAAACTNTPPGNKDVTANANTANANKSAETKSMGTVSESDIIAKEKASWDAIKKKDWDGFAKMLASDYIEVLDDGVHDKAAGVTSVKDFELSDATFADWKMLPIDKDAVLITYTATVKGKFKGEDVPPGPYREASAYVNRNGEWVAIYYQETLSQPPAASTPTPATAQPKKEAPKKEAPSPTAKPAVAGPDVTANEKMVWDTFKTRNYDAFAALLADNFMEIEADGVFDKAGSVKAVTGMDMSKFQLSDWKTVKFDDDASLVTYVVTAPGMKPEKAYHSTIWMSRDGKWQALFHQGTPAAASMPAKPGATPVKPGATPAKPEARKSPV